MQFYSLQKVELLGGRGRQDCRLYEFMVSKSSLMILWGLEIKPSQCSPGSPQLYSLCSLTQYVILSRILSPGKARTFSSITKPNHREEPTSHHQVRRQEYLLFSCQQTCVLLDLTQWLTRLLRTGNVSLSTLQPSDRQVSRKTGTSPSATDSNNVCLLFINDWLDIQS